MAIAGALAWLLERPLVVREPLQRLDAIVVLGAPLAPDGALSPIALERVDAAAKLFGDGGAPIVVATGGTTRGAPIAEAEAMAAALRARGVGEGALIVEAASQTTAENARRTAELLSPRGARAVWIVTQPFHGRRAARLFRAAGLEAHVWHIDDSLEYRDRRRALRWLTREYAAWGRLLVRSARNRKA